MQQQRQPLLRPGANLRVATFNVRTGHHAGDMEILAHEEETLQRGAKGGLGTAHSARGTKNKEKGKQKKRQKREQNQGQEKRAKDTP